MKKIIKPSKKKRFINFNKVFNLLNLLIIISILILPYYLFQGRLFLGGDDTRFYFTYPKLFLDSLVPYSWNNISSLPYYIPNHQWLPFVFVLSLIDSLLKSPMALSYFAFSAVLIIGFIYFQKFIHELMGVSSDISFTAAVMYIFSPITLVSLSYFLSPIWLIALVPIIAYYYIRFIKTGGKQFIVKIVLWSIFLSFSFFSVPWILGIIFPLLGGLVFYLLTVENPLKKVFKRTLIFVFFVGASQLFWAIPFFFSLVSGGQTSLGQKVFSEDLAQSFASTVMVTANDNIIYPILNFYHRQLVFDFEWQLKNVFVSFYDKTFIFSSIYAIVLFLGFIKYSKGLLSTNRKIFIFFAAAFLIVLYLGTVNIGFLKQLFVLFVYLPGFAILRNFTDKFALSFIFFYSSLFALCLLAIKNTSRFYYPILLAVLLVVLINFLPVKSIIASPLWKTKGIYTTTNIPVEYTSFLKDVKTLVPIDSNVISFPQNIATYAIVTEQNNKNAYIGTSPFKFITGINDLSGEGSYPPYISLRIQDDIVSKNYKDLLETLSKINVGYIMKTNNIPSEVLNSYLYNKKYLKFQDDNFINSIVQHEVVKSKNGNYVIYKLKNSPRHIYSSIPVSYERITPIHYKVKIKNVSKQNILTFLETFHPGWKLFLSNHVASNNLLSELSLISRQPIFENTHTFISPYGNRWTLSSDYITNNFDKSYYEKNPDGTVNVVLDIYFAPQSYFYIGITLTFAFLFLGFYILFNPHRNEKKRKK